MRWPTPGQGHRSVPTADDLVSAPGAGRIPATPVLAGIQAFLGVVLLLFAIFPPLPLTPRTVFLTLSGAAVWAVAIAGLVVLVSIQVHGLERRLRFDAEHDPLTGSLNRLGLEARSRAVGGIAARTGVPVSVALIDLDDFKALNDARGHRAGDELLHDLAAGWQSQLRAGDLLARYGGDEFALVLPGTAPAEAELLLARLRSAAPGAWTAGVAAWPPAESVYDALARADRVLYQAKAGGGEAPDGQTTP